MKTKFTHDFMHQNKGCYIDSELNACSFMGKKEVRLADIIDSEIPTKDKFWFVCRKVLTKEQNQNLSLGVANIVEALYAHKHPTDTRVKDCLEATQQYLDGTITRDQLLEKRRAAAYAAAYAAVYAAPAAAAVYAAAYAAYAADAADAAVYAAYAAAAAVYAAPAADYKELARICKQAIIDYLILFLESEGL